MLIGGPPGIIEPMNTQWSWGGGFETLDIGSFSEFIIPVSCISLQTIDIFLEEP